LSTAVISAPHPLRVEVVDSTAGLEAIRAEWDALYASGIAGTNPFLRWSWVAHWWRSVNERPGLPRTRLHILAMYDRDSQLRCIAPFFLGLWQIGPFAFKALRLYGFHTTLTDLRTILIAPGWEPAAAEALISTLWALRREYHVSVIDGLDHSSQFTSSLTARLGRSARHGPELMAYVLPLPTTWDALRVRLTRNNRGSIQQGYSALKRDHRDYRFEELTEPEDIPSGLNEMFFLHALRAASRAGPRHHDYYASPDDRAFLRQIVAHLATQGLARVCRLRVGDKVVASRVVLLAGNGVYLYHAGHDPTWDRYRVGTVLTAECIQMAIRSQAATVHFGTGTEPSKLRWSPQRQTLEQLHIAAPTPAGEILSDLTWRLAVVARRLRNRWPHHRWLTVGGLPAIPEVARPGRFP
jgi:CelD/BcsL family acetyltransferase involved in cellulose biosynthesis